MLQGTVIRGTTPLHEFELPLPLEIIKDVRVSYGQNKKVIFVKEKDECKIEDGKLSIRLSQEDTFMFRPEKKLYIEIRIQTTDEQIIQTEEPVVLRVVDTLDEEVMI